MDHSIEAPDRREFMTFSTAAMAGSLVFSYGTLAIMAGRYLYPPSDLPKAWMFVDDLASIEPGASFDYETPTGEKVVIARQGADDSVDSFIALSSTCPHLGCQVSWQSQEESFYCPCHNGRFTAEGEATEGPPAASEQWLPRYPLKVENGLLFVEVITESVVSPSLETRPKEA